MQSHKNHNLMNDNKTKSFLLGFAFGFLFSGCFRLNLSFLVLRKTNLIKDSRNDHYVARDEKRARGGLKSVFYSTPIGDRGRGSKIETYLRTINETTRRIRQARRDENKCSMSITKEKSCSNSSQREFVTQFVCKSIELNKTLYI